MTQFTGAEQMFWAEINDTLSTRRSIKVCYAFLLAENAGGGVAMWQAVHMAIAKRFKMRRLDELEAFQKAAVGLYQAAAAVIPPKFEMVKEDEKKLVDDAARDSGDGDGTQGLAGNIQGDG